MLLDTPHEQSEKLNFSSSQYYKNVIPRIMGFRNKCLVNNIQVTHTPKNLTTDLLFGQQHINQYQKNWIQTTIRDFICHSALTVQVQYLVFVI